MNLTELANRYDSDKGSRVRFCHRYTYLYDLLFSPLKLEKINFLEMGLAIGGPETTAGSVDRMVDSPSIKMWSDYFPNARLFGFDISDFSHMKAENFTFLRGDSGSVEDLQKLAALAPSFDIIVDDASHASYHQQLALKVLWPSVSPGGLYIIEDLHWQSPVFEATMPRTPKTSDLMNAFFDQRVFIENPVFTVPELLALQEQVVAFGSFPAFDGTASPTKLIVLRKKA